MAGIADAAPRRPQRRPPLFQRLPRGLPKAPLAKIRALPPAAQAGIGKALAKVPAPVQGILKNLPAPVPKLLGAK